MTIVVITGGSRGLGAAAARACAHRGMGVLLTYNANPDSAMRVVDDITADGGTAVALPLNIGDVASFGEFRDSLQAALRTTWGREDFDALVNNAGYAEVAPIAAVTEAHFDALFSVNVKGPLFLTQTLLPRLIDGGHIVNISSSSARVATPGVGVYASSKGALEVLTRYMAKELGERKIRVNAIAPGGSRTELGGGGINEEVEAALAAQTALGRMGEPEDIGTAVAALLSKDNRWVNAQIIEVSGGYSI
ncbi:3-oxoacyl-ACP reductase [Mycolicibacterium fortuitum]|uniref:3-oxoacyl-ACP reductase n=1 Tax=Mycolicibacterium fortuitum TaxID=1766 RepID=A0ABD6QI30_MYCFO|nr:SDR family oxidoreductase [Mycolicibacterium fortuitum]OMC39746.1 3-oxoacyl-ACP reductase [Mycolicibacterium fortuitum]